MLHTQLPTLLHTVDQIKQFEQYLINDTDISEQELMRVAGKDAFSALQLIWPQASSIVVVCGAGNNAGDGYTLACCAQQANLIVTVYYLIEPSQLSGAARVAAQECEALGIVMLPFASVPENLNIDVIVDAILGTGLSRDVDGDFAKAIEWLNVHAANILSLDVPSGLQSDTGIRCGFSIEADVTVCFLGVKRGLLTADGTECAGDIVWSDLDIPKETFAHLSANCSRFLFSDLPDILPLRSSNVHKGNFGHVLIIGGNIGMAGSVCLAARSALQTGAGLVTVATRPQHVTAVVTNCPEAMCFGITNTSELSQLLASATVVVLGPGLGQDEWAHDLWQLAIQSTQPLIVDADGLNILALQPQCNDNWVLTPHPGEASRLLGVSRDAVQADRFAAGTDLQKKFGGAILLKGAGSIIVDDEGWLEICDAGNPGMASAGMGDLLSGIIAGLVAQGMDISCAATCGAMIHAQAGDCAADELGERGLLASNLLPFVRQIVNIGE